MPSQEMYEIVERHGGQLRQALARNCLAVRVSVHGVTRERTIGEAKVTLNDRPVEDEFQATGKLRLIPAEIAKDMDRIAGRARQLPGRYGVRMPGMYLIPIGALENGPASRMFEELNSVRAEYAAAAEAHKTRWAEHVERLKTANPDIYKLISRKLRTAEEFVAAHTIDTMIMPLAGVPEDLGQTMVQQMLKEGLSSEAAKRVVTHMQSRIDEYSITGLATEHMTATWAKEVARLTQTAMTATIEEMMSQPLSEFTEALKGLETKLNQGNIIRRDSIESVRQAYQKLTDFAFILPEDLKTRLDAIGKELDPDRARLVSGERNKTSAQALSELLRGSREEIDKLDITTRSVLGAKRILNLDD